MIYTLGQIIIEKFYTKNCFFDATSIVKNSNKEKWVYSSHCQDRLRIIKEDVPSESDCWMTTVECNSDTITILGNLYRWLITDNKLC